MSSVNVLQKKLASMLDQSITPPTEGGTEWNLRLEYLNISQRDWVESYQWPTLYKEVNTRTSQSTGNATITLPSDFRKLDGFLDICFANTVKEYAQILPNQKPQYDPTVEYMYILGNPSNGYSMVVNPGTHGSGASISYSYWSTGATLASSSDVTMCPDPNYLMNQAAYYYWQSRDDGRSQVAKAEADRILGRMLEYETVRGVSYDDSIRTRESLNSFRIGRD